MIETTDKDTLRQDTSSCVIELSMPFRQKQPKWVQTLADFSKFWCDDGMVIATTCQRCDVIIDHYFERSLKEGTGDSHSKLEDLPIHSVKKFLTNNTNKTNPNKHLAKTFIHNHEGKELVSCVTFGNSIVSNNETVLSERNQHNPFTSEEADARIGAMASILVRKDTQMSLLPLLIVM